MLAKISIALRLPDANHPDRHFSFRLQSDIHNQPCVYRTARKLFVVSNMKGNLRPFYKLLMKNKIIDQRFQWTFGEGHLVVLGNCFDSGDPATEYLWFLYDLEQKASLKGGYVHFIPGSHEIMHINGKWPNTHLPYALATAKIQGPFTALYDASFELRRWLSTKNLVEKIGNLLFVHGSVFFTLNAKDQTITDINNSARSLYTRFPRTLTKELSPFFFADEDIFIRHSDYQNIINTEDQVNVILAKFSVDTIVTGYILEERISATFDGKLINVAINYANDNPAGLFIKQGKFLQADRQGKKEKVKIYTLL